MNINRSLVRIGVILSACIFLSVNVQPGIANEGGHVFEPYVAPPAKKKKAAPTKAVRRNNEQRSTRKVTRRVARVVETAPSGLPPQSETRYLADQVIVRYRLVSRQRDLDALVARLDLRHLEGRTFALAGATLHRYAIASGASVAETIAALEADPNVVYAQPNYVYALQQNTVAASGAQYALDRLDVRAVLDVTRGHDVRIAVIDSAIDISHPELAHSSLEVIDVSDSWDGKPTAHGTSIAGIIVAGASLTGVAPDAYLIGVTAFSPDSTGQARGNSWTVAKGMDAAWRAGAQVFNLSFAGPPDPLVENELNGAARRGIIAFAAAGNDGPKASPLYPAAYVSTVAVTATDADDAIYDRANGGDYVAVAAPGVDILALAPGGSFAFSSGTSLAAAHASGLAALALSAAPNLKPRQIEELIAGTSKDLGAPGRDPVFGAGIPDARRLIDGARAH